MHRPTRLLSTSLLLGLLIASVGVAADKFEIQSADAGPKVMKDGELFTQYLLKSGAKPVLWPIIGPDGKQMTRTYPLADALPTEKNDHIHHRSLWFTHGEVRFANEEKYTSFWHEQDGGGNINHREFTKQAGGDTATLTSVNDWINADGKKMCEDERTLVFGTLEDGTPYIDFDVTVTASEADIVFDDTKEGSFGIRVPGTMKVDAKKGGKITNAEGITDKDAWAKSSKWVDYTGPVDGKELGITIMNHPSSFRYPTGWHVRTYGLFAANPFAEKAFTGKGSGALEMKKGDIFTLRYRVLFHDGDWTTDDVEKAFQEYAKKSY